MRLTGSLLSVILVLGIVGGSSGQQAPPKTEAKKPADNAAADAKAWPVAFADTAAPAVRADATRFTVAPLVTNASSAQQNVTASLVLRSAAGAPVKAAIGCTLRSPHSKTTASPSLGSASSANASPGSPVVFPSCDLTLPQGSGAVLLEATIAVHEAPREAYPLNGVLILQPVDKGNWTDEQPRATLALSSIPLESAASMDWQIVSAAGLGALIVVAIAAMAATAFLGGAIWTKRMGSASFSFSDSWSGALMVGGPLLTALVTTFSGFPDNPQTMGKKSYVFLSLLLSGLIAFGPAIFNLGRVPTPIKDAAGKWTLQNQGYVPFFFLAAVVALTGGLAQLTLLRVLFADLASAQVLSATLGTVLASACSILLYVVLGASVVSMVMTVRAATTPEPEPPVAEADPTAVRGPAAPAGSPRLPEWSMP